MGRYRRTVSFPNPPTPNPRPVGPVAKGFHVRSASLPCGRSHPLIPHLRHQVAELRTWDGPGSGSIASGLAHLKAVLDALDDVLQLPLTQDSLSSKTDVVERLLEDFLRFVDVYGIFRASMLGLKQEVSAAQVALRRKDDSRLGLYIKAQKKIAGEVGKLISAIGSAPLPDMHPPMGPDYDDELGQVIRDVHRLTASVSEAVFRSVLGSFGLGRRPGWASFGQGKKVRKEEQQGIMVGGVESLLELRKINKGENNNNNNNNNNKKINEEEELRMKVLKKMQELEDCVGEMERESERVFRSLISARVSLLNILTHA